MDYSIPEGVNCFCMFPLRLVPRWSNCSHVHDWQSSQRLWPRTPESRKQESIITKSTMQLMCTKRKKEVYEVYSAIKLSMFSLFDMYSASWTSWTGHIDTCCQTINQFSHSAWILGQGQQSNSWFNWALISSTSLCMWTYLLFSRLHEGPNIKSFFPLTLHPHSLWGHWQCEEPNLKEFKLKTHRSNRSFWCYILVLKVRFGWAFIQAALMQSLKSPYKDRKTRFSVCWCSAKNDKYVPEMSRNKQS